MLVVKFLGHGFCSAFFAGHWNISVVKLGKQRALKIFHAAQITCVPSFIFRRLHSG